MNSLAALRRLRDAREPVVTTADAAALFSESSVGAAKTMSRLADAGLVRAVKRGLWAIAENVDPLSITDAVTAPHPSYVSLYSALFYHGMIEQIPAVIYVVSLARSHIVRTTIGTFSVHRVAPEFFGGFDFVGESRVKVASAEKALLDVLYLAGTKTRLFASFPELEFPRTFRVRVAREWIQRIRSIRLRTLVSRGFDAVRRG